MPIDDEYKKEYREKCKRYFSYIEEQSELYAKTIVDSVKYRPFKDGIYTIVNCTNLYPRFLYIVNRTNNGKNESVCIDFTCPRDLKALCKDGESVGTLYHQILYTDNIEKHKPFLINYIKEFLARYAKFYYVSGIKLEYNNVKFDENKEVK